MVGPDPHRPGPARARLLVEQVPIWAIIGQIGAVGGTTEPADVTAATVFEVAHDFDIPEVAVIAALRYYEQHRGAVDTLLAANAEALI
jgi:hypothetical protein